MQILHTPQFKVPYFLSTIARNENNSLPAVTHLLPQKFKKDSQDTMTCLLSTTNHDQGYLPAYRSKMVMMKFEI